MVRKRFTHRYQEIFYGFDERIFIEEREMYEKYFHYRVKRYPCKLWWI